MQVTKDPIGTKGARLTMEVSIPGRYLVYVPDGEGVGVSRRLPDKERERLRKLASGLKLKNAGLIIRTAAARRAQERHGARAPVPVPAPRGAPGARRGVPRRRRWCSRRPTCRSGSCATCTRKEFDRAVIDDQKQHHRMTSFFTRTAPELVDRVELYKGAKTCSRAPA